jgi:membrane protein required for colicin V production
MAWQSALCCTAGGKVTSINILDLGIGILILLFLVRGLLRGFVYEVAGLIGLFLGLFLAGKFYPLLTPQFAGFIESPRWAASLAYGTILILALIFVGLCAAVFKRFVGLTFAAWLDNLLGLMAGALKGTFVCAIILALMQRFVPGSPFLENAFFPEYIGGFVTIAHTLLLPFLGTAFPGYL